MSCINIRVFQLSYIDILIADIVVVIDSHEFIVEDEALDQT